MSSLKPKESGSYVAPPPPRQSSWIPIALIVAIIAIAAVAFGEYSTKSSLESRIAELEQEVQQVKDAHTQDVKKLQGSTESLASDLTVVTKKIGVTTDELTPVPSARRKAAPGTGPSGCSKRGTRQRNWQRRPVPRKLLLRVMKRQPSLLKSRSRRTPRSARFPLM